MKVRKQDVGTVLQHGERGEALANIGVRTTDPGRGQERVHHVPPLQKRRHGGGLVHVPGALSYRPHDSGPRRRACVPSSKIDPFERKREARIEARRTGLGLNRGRGGATEIMPNVDEASEVTARAGSIAGLLYVDTAERERAERAEMAAEAHRIADGGAV